MNIVSSISFGFDSVGLMHVVQGFSILASPQLCSPDARAASAGTRDASLRSQMQSARKLIKASGAQLEQSRTWHWRAHRKQTAIMQARAGMQARSVSRGSIRQQQHVAFGSARRHAAHTVVRRSTEAAAAAVDEASSSGAPSNAAPTSDTWELDFCSRPLLDERGKKVWELVVTDTSRSFEYTQYFPNSKINSIEVRRTPLVAHAACRMPDAAWIALNARRGARRCNK
jgi:hypothetical protein